MESLPFSLVSGTLEERLFLACSRTRSDLSEVSKLLKEGADPNAKDSDGATPLHCVLRTPSHVDLDLPWCGVLFDDPDVLKIVNQLLSRSCDPMSGDNRQRTPLHHACQRGRSSVVKLLIDSYRCYPEVRDIDQKTPLHYACEAGQSKVLKLLIQTYNCDPEVRDRDLMTPLHYACQGRWIRIVNLLLDVFKCDPNIKNKAGLTPLELTHPRSIGIIAELVHRGANPNVVLSNGDTPLHVACRAQALNIVKCVLDFENCPLNVKNKAGLTPLQVTYHDGIINNLIQHGADPNVVDGNSNTPLHMACQHGAQNTVHSLLESSKFECDPNLEDKAGLTPIQVTNPKETGIITDLVQHGADPNVVDSNSNTPLHMACRHGAKNTVHSLLESSKFECDPNLEDKAGLTPIQVTNAKETAIIRDLVQHHADPNVVDGNSNTPLHMACRCGAQNTVHWLLESSKLDCDPNIKNKAGLTPLQLTNPKETGIITDLVQHHADPNVVDKFNGNTPLHMACRDGVSMTVHRLLRSPNHCNSNIKNKGELTPIQVTNPGATDIIRDLVQHGADPNVVDSNSNTPLHLACLCGAFSTVRCLLESSKFHCNPNVANIDGNTPLHMACKHGALNPVKYLLEATKCDPNCENKMGQSPLEILEIWSADIIRELIRHGANPKQVYQTHGNVLPTTKPLQPPVKVFIVGNPSTGKSTLTASLKKESSTFGRFSKVSGVDEKTAGIDPHEFHSKKYGSVTLYDFAGQRSYYSSHAAVLRNAIQSSPIFILVVELIKNDEEIVKDIMFWLSFLRNQKCSLEDKPHLIIVGSHADKVNSSEEKAEEKVARVIESLPPISDFHLAGAIPIDCRYPTSTGMTKLRQCLKQSSNTLRISVTISFNAHCFFIYLLDKFRTSTAVTVREIQAKITSASSDKKLMGFIPESLWALCNICDELNDRGHILYLKDHSIIENSWVILDKAALLSEVTGTIFAPADFKQHCILASSTGVVPLSNISRHFPNHNIEMLIAFLYHLEFCREITDPEARSLIIEHHQSSIAAETEHSDTELYFLFPGLIRLDAPENIWEINQEFTCYFGWKLQCQPGQFFTTRLLQVLILRLAFSFALAPDHRDVQSKVPAFQRKCSIWKSGIFWGDRFGVEVLVEMLPTNDTLTLVMRCHNSNLVNLLQLRTTLIRKVLGVAEEICNRVPTEELFVNPSDCTQYPMKSTTSFGLREIASAVIGEESHPSVVFSTGNVFRLENLLIYEPYAGLGKSIIRDLFSESCDGKISNRVLARIAERVSHSRDTLIKLFKPNPTILAERISKSAVTSPSQEVLFILQIWRDGCEGTYQRLREKLDQFSIFAERSPMVLAGVSTENVKDVDQQSPQMDESDPLEPVNRRKPTSQSPHSGQHAVLKSEPTDTQGDDCKATVALPLKSDRPTLKNLQLLKCRGGRRVKVIKTVAADWKHLATSLGIEGPVLRSIEMGAFFQPEEACRQVFIKWLDGGDGLCEPVTWDTLIQCLIEAGLVDVAEELEEVLSRLQCTHYLI